MEKIVFAHSNGFSAKTYQYFLQQLAPYQVTAIDKIGVKEGWKNWNDLIPDFIAHIEDQHKEPIVGIGHSLGAAVLFFTAVQRPDLFSKIILIEPPIFGFQKRFMFWLFTKIGIADKFSPAGKAAQRRDFFESRTAAYQALRNKGIFKHFDENCFGDYIQYGFREVENGIILDYPKALETKVFQNPPFFFKHQQLEMPVHFIHSAHYKTLSVKDIQWWKRTFPTINYHEFDGGHMFPLEKPIVTADFLKNLMA